MSLGPVVRMILACTAVGGSAGAYTYTFSPATGSVPWSLSGTMIITSTSQTQEFTVGQSYQLLVAQALAFNPQAQP